MISTHPLQLECLTHMGFNLSLLKEANAVYDGLPDPWRVVLAVVAPEETHDRDVLDEENVGWNLGYLTAGEADDDEASLP